MRRYEEQSFLRPSGSKIIPRFCWSQFLPSSSGCVCVVGSSGSKSAAQHRCGRAATSSTPGFRGLSSCSLLPVGLLWPGGDPGTASGIKINHYIWGHKGKVGMHRLGEEWDAQLDVEDSGTKTLKKLSQS